MGQYLLDAEDPFPAGFALVTTGIRRVGQARSRTRSGTLPGYARAR